MWTSPLAENGYAAAQWGTLLAATLIATATDLRSRRIPNLLTGPLFVAGLVHAWFAAGVIGLVDGGIASVLVAMPYVLLFVFAGGGAGDAKLMAGVGAWLGLSYGLVALVLTCLSGAVMAMVIAHRSGRLAAVLADVRQSASAAAPLAASGSVREAAAHLPTTKGKQTMPYGPAILAGVALTGLGVFL